jgi:hypothetical protein
VRRGQGVGHRSSEQRLLPREPSDPPDPTSCSYVVLAKDFNKAYRKVAKKQDTEMEFYS